MTDTRKWFEYFFNSKEMRDSSGAIKQEWIDFIGSGKAYEIWQACQSLNDNRIQQLLAVIELQREALVNVRDNVYNADQAEIIAHKALAIKPENVELVEVIVSHDKIIIAKDVSVELPFETKLYTIKTKS